MAIKQKPMWQIKQAAEPNTLELYIYGDVEPDSYDWWTDEKIESKTSADYFRDKLNDYSDIQFINIYINSNGGDAFEGTAIYNQLKRHPAYKTVYVDGFACSIASVIAMAGDKVVMPANTMMMIHNAYFLMAGGSAPELRSLADALDKINEGSRQAYLMKAGDKLAEDELIRMMDAETWLTAADCVRLGLADEIPDYQADSEKMTQMMQKTNVTFSQQLATRKMLAAEARQLFKNEDMEKQTPPTKPPQVVEETKPNIEEPSLAKKLAGFFYTKN